MGQKILLDAVQFIMATGWNFCWPKMTQALDPKQCLFTNLGCKLEPRREGLVESIWESCGDIRVASWRHLEASWKHLVGIYISEGIWKPLGHI